MKTCSKCGSLFADDKLSCPFCGGAPVNGRPGQQNNQYRQDIHSKYGDQQRPDTGYYKVNDDGMRMPDWYESLWFIIITALVGAWPITIAMIALRTYRNSLFQTVQPIRPGQNAQGQAGQAGAQHAQGQTAQNAQGQARPNQGPARPRPSKAKGTWKLIVGSILAGFGLMAIGTIPGSEQVLMDIMMSAIFIAVGGIMIGSFMTTNRHRHMYEALINNRGNTKISFIASRVGKKTSTVRTQLQKLINKGFLSEPAEGISAYINGEYDLVVMMKNGKPIVPVEETMAKEIAKKKAQEEAEAEKKRREAAVSPEDKFILALDDASGLTDDVDVIGYLKRMKNSMTNIKKLLEEEPEDNERKSIQKMKTSYIPSTIEMIEKYTDPSTSDEAKSQIKGMFSTMATAYKNIEKQLQQQDDIDTGIDIEVLKQTLARDGLLDSDFDVKA